MRSVLGVLLPLLVLLPACGGPPVTGGSPASGNPPPPTAASDTPCRPHVGSDLGRFCPPVAEAVPEDQRSAPKLSERVFDEVAPLSAGNPEATDNRFEQKTWFPCGCKLDDAVPWYNDIPFDPNHPYTPEEQNRVVAAEKTLFNASETTEPIQPTGGSIRQLWVRLRDGDLPRLPRPEEDRYPLFPGVAIMTSENNFGNDRFGSGFHNQTTIVTRGRTITTTSNTTIRTSLFNNRRDLARFVVDSAMTCAQVGAGGGSGTNPLAQAVPFIMGQQVTGGRREWNATFPPNRNSQARQRAQVYRSNRRDFFSARMTFMVGPVNMTVAGGISGEVGLDVGGDLTCTEMSLDALATARLQVFTSASVGVRVIRIGIEGRLNLIDVSIPTHAHVAWGSMTSAGCVNWNGDVSRNVTSLSGQINLFAIVRFLFFNQRYDLTIADWSGLTWNSTIHQRNGSFCLTN